MGIFDKWSGGFTAKIIDADLSKLPGPDTIVVNLDHSEEIREQYRGFKRIVLVMDGVSHEFKAADFLNAMERMTETCHMHRDAHGIWHCSACEEGADGTTGSDGALESWNDSWAPNFCPHCGRRVVDE